MAQNSQINCYQCEKELTLETGVNLFRSEECPHCDTSLRCCKMCSFYDKTVYNNCRESNAERIIEKEKANFCDFFTLSGAKNNAVKENALNAANALFK